MRLCNNWCQYQSSCWRSISSLCRSMNILMSHLMHIIRLLTGALVVNLLQVSTSRRFRNERGGNQGTVLMPLNFILLTHYVYLRGDPYRKHMLGRGEPQPMQTPGRCDMCDELYPVWMQAHPDGHCRGCQLIRQLPDEGYDDTDDSMNQERELSAARRQFDELNVSNTGTLCEEEIATMVKQLRPARTTTLNGIPLYRTLVW